jgi:excisionase family DNA binding protein
VALDPAARRSKRDGRVKPPYSEEIPARLWTVEECAGFLQVSTKTVRVLYRREGLPGFRLRSRLRFLPSDVLRWIAERKGGV